MIKFKPMSLWLCQYAFNLYLFINVYPCTFPTCQLFVLHQNGFISSKQNTFKQIYFNPLNVLMCHELANYLSFYHFLKNLQNNGKNQLFIKTGRFCKIELQQNGNETTNKTGPWGIRIMQKLYILFFEYLYRAIYI